MDNGKQPAFPLSGIETDLEGDGSGQKFPHVYSYEKDAGLTKRELFAAMAMQGLCMNALYPQSELETRCRGLGNLAVMQADALLVALEGQREGTDE